MSNAEKQLRQPMQPGDGWIRMQDLMRQLRPNTYDEPVKASAPDIDAIRASIELGAMSR